MEFLKYTRNMLNNLPQIRARPNRSVSNMPCWEKWRHVWAYTSFTLDLACKINNFKIKYIFLQKTTNTYFLMQQNQDKFLDFLRCVIIGYIPANISNNFQHTHAISYRHNIIITGREMYNFFYSNLTSISTMTPALSHTKTTMRGI